MRDPTPPTPSLLRRTATDQRYLLTLADGRPVLAAAIPLIRRLADRQGREQALFFARPSLARDASGEVRSITWYGPSGERPVRFSALDSRDRTAVEASLRAHLQALEPLMDDPAMGPLLSVALLVPGMDDVLVLGRTPILTGWGTVPAGVLEPQSIATHFERTLGAYAPFTLQAALIAKAMGFDGPSATDEAESPETEPAAETATAPVDRTPAISAAAPPPSPPAPPPAVRLSAPSTAAPLVEGSVGSAQGASSLARSVQPPSFPTPHARNPASPTTEAPAARSQPKLHPQKKPQSTNDSAVPPVRSPAIAPPVEPPTKRAVVPGSIIAAAILAVLLGLSYVPNVVRSSPAPESGAGEATLAVTRAINATLARSIAAADSLTATVCLDEPNPSLASEWDRLLVPAPSTLLVPAGSGTISERLEAHTIRLDTIPSLDGAATEPVASLTLITPTSAIGPDRRLRAAEVVARADNTTLEVTGIQPLPEGLALYELGAAAPGATTLTGTSLPTWRTPVFAAFAPRFDDLPDVILTTGAIASGAPGAPVPISAGIAHTAPVANAAGGGIFDLCGRLVAIARDLDGAAMPITRLTRALSAAGTPISVTDHSCQPSRGPQPLAIGGPAMPETRSLP